MPRRGVVYFYVYVAVTKSRFQLSSTSDGDTDRRPLRLYLDVPDLRPVFRISRHEEVEVPRARYQEKADGN